MHRGWVALLLMAVGTIWLAVRPATADDTRGWDRAEDDLSLDSFSERFRDLFLGEPHVYWDRGIHFQTEKKSLDLHFGYEFQGDLIWYSDMDDQVEMEAGQKWLTGAIIRRSRVYFEGFVLKYWYFRARFNWNLIQEPTFQDLFVEYTGFRQRLSEWLPVIRLGQVKEPMSLDWMTGANWTTFAERSMATASLAANRNPGLRIHGAFFDKRMTYQAGFYGINVASLGEYRSGTGEAVTARLTGLPWAPKSTPGRYVHLGMSASVRWNASSLSYESNPESFGGPDVVSTGQFRADRVQTYAGEAVLSVDRWSFQAEGIWSRIELEHGATADYYGWYAQGSYFLTSTCRNFRRKMGSFGRIAPERVLFCKAREGMGALEVAGRISYLDLDDGPHKGGEVYNLTLGLNWYARDNVRITANAMYTSVKGAYGQAGADGTMTTLLLRFQYNL